LSQAKNASDAFDALVKGLAATLPDRKKARDEAAAKVDQGEAAAKDAKTAVDDRMARDLKDAAARLEELRAMKKK
jgi:hypothetical protein